MGTSRNSVRRTPARTAMNAGLIVRIALLTCMAMTSRHALAENEQVFGEWMVSMTDDRDALFAATFNDSGAIFGKWCTVADGKCVWLLGMNVSCTAKGENAHPTLVNTTKGATTLQVRCGGPISGGTYRYVFSSWQELESALDGSERVGFAFPLDSGKFEVVRFSLNGMQQACNLAEKATAKLSSTSTKNEQL